MKILANVPLKTSPLLILRPPGKLETKGVLEKPHPFKFFSYSDSTPRLHKNQIESQVPEGVNGGKHNTTRQSKQSA